MTLSIREDYYDVKHAAVRRMGSDWGAVATGATATQAGGPGTLPERSTKHSKTLVQLAREIYG